MRDIISEEEKDLIIGICSDVLKRKFMEKTDGYLIYRDLLNRAKIESKEKAQKTILGYLVSHSGNNASQPELVKVSYKLMNELRKDDE